MSGSSWTRRGALSGAISAVTGSYILQNVRGKSERKKRVVTARGGPNNEPRENKRVPVRWRRNEIAVENAVEKLAKEVMQYDFVQSVGSRISSRYIGSQIISTASITVDESATESEVNQLPGNLNDIGVNSKDIIIPDIQLHRESGRGELLACDGAKTDSNFHAGWAVQGPEGSNGTAGYPLYDGDDEYILTANHVTKSGGGTCNVGIEANDAYEDYIGDVKIAQQDHDWAAVLISGKKTVESINNSLYYDGGRYAPVAGYKNDDGVRALKGVTGAAKAQGFTTGFTEGTVVENDTWFVGGENGCYAGDGQDIKVKNEGSQYVAEGDSGGPIFDYNASTGEALAITMTAVGQSDQGTVSCGGAKAYSKVHGYSVEAIINNNPFNIG